MALYKLLALKNYISVGLTNADNISLNLGSTSMFSISSTAAEHLFALLQSVGFIGTAETTKGTLGGATGALAYFLSHLYSNCEME